MTAIRTTPRRAVSLVVAFALGLLMPGTSALATGSAAYRPVTSARLLNAQHDSGWLMYRRSYDSRGYAPFTQITPANVSRLKIAFTYKTGLKQGHEAPPVVNGRYMFITTPLDHLLMEGMRQNDELAAQADSLPAPGTRLALKTSRERLPRGLRPPTQEILLLLENHRLVEDVLDQSQRPDLEVLRILRVLLEKGLVEEVREGPSGEPVPLLTSGEVMAVREYFNEGDVLLEEASAKLVLLCTSAEQVCAFVQSLQGHAEFRPGDNGLPAGAEPGLGDIGRLVVGETFSLRLFCLPAGAGTAPLWTPFSRRLFGVAALGEGNEMAAAVSFFETDCHVPVARLRFSGPESRDGFLLAPDDRRSLRRLLAFCASRFTGEPLSEEVS